MLSNKDERYDRQSLVNELEASGCVVNSNGTVICSFHEDRNPSGSIYRGDDSVWRYKCHATGCVFNTPGDILDVHSRRTGKPLGQLLHIETAKSTPIPSKPPQPLDKLISGISSVEAVYRYSDPVTQKIDMVVVRYLDNGKKKFFQIRPEGDGFVMGGPNHPLPLYNRGRILKSSSVVICEGEKAVHALHDIGIVATTSPGGAGKAKHSDWTPLSGKECILWPDNDPPDKNGHCAGARHMDDVQTILQGLEPPCKIRRIDETSIGVPLKGDAFEFVAAIPGSSDDKRKVVIDLLSEAKGVSAAGCLFDLFNEITSGNYQNITLPWTAINTMSRALLPGKVTIICGDPGATKSFFLDAMLIHFMQSGIKFAAYKLEDELHDHLNRIFAQRAGVSFYIDAEWVKKYSADTISEAEKLRPFLDNMARRITCIPPEGIDLKGLADWVDKKSKEGNRVIAIDPITAATVKGNQWEADLNFMMSVKNSCRENGASLILVTHPKQRKIIGPAGINDISGGSAYTRFAHTVLWIINHGTDGKTATFTHPDGERYNREINRTISILKARNGPGQGVNIGFEFDQDRLQFNEVGIIEKRKDRGKNNYKEDDEECPF